MNHHITQIRFDSFAQNNSFLEPAPKYPLSSAIWHLLTGIALPFILVGCATPGQYFNETTFVDTTGAYQLTDREAFETIDLGNLLYQYAPQDKENINHPGNNPPTPVTNVEQTGAASTSSYTQKQQLDEALSYYNRRIQQTGDMSQKKASRNALQERLLAASAQRCNAYKGNLQRTFSRTNFGLGVLSTIAGTAGALVSTAGAASAWSGISAISSGTRAEFNQDYMSNLAAYVIVDGIDKRRQAIYEQIQNRGQAKSYEAYPVEAAIKDALYYHGQCTVIAGFQEASESIKYANEPGIDMAINAMAKIHSASQMVQGSEKSPETILLTAGKITSSTAQVAGSSLVDEGGIDTALGSFTSQVTHITSTNTQIKKAVDDLVAKANKITILKNNLDKLGLKNTFDAPTENIKPGLHASCLKKISDYASAESIDRSNAGLEKDGTARSLWLAKADLSKTQREEITAMVKILAEDYQSKSQKFIAELNTLFDKVLPDKAINVVPAIADEFKKKISNLHLLDAEQERKLEGLCKIE